MFIVNPPFTLEATLKEVLPYLVEVLGEDAGAGFVLETGNAATAPRAASLQQAENNPRGGLRAPVSPHAIGPGGSLRGNNAPAPRGSLRTSSRPGTPGAGAGTGTGTGRPGSPGASYSRPAGAKPVAKLGTDGPRTGAPRNTKPRRP
jgi:23S rRNA (adenine2030-N6)-methyltransferase